MKENERLDEFFTYLRLLSRKITKLRTNAVKDVHLKTIHVECLFYLIYKGSLSSSQLVRYTLEDKAAISKAIKDLKEQNYVSYGNKYNEKISLTEKGTILAKRIEEKSAEILLTARRDISDEDAGILLSVLKKIYCNLEEAED
jgi:DNA-binding MarR family transcriptional regulator